MIAPTAQRKSRIRLTKFLLEVEFLSSHETDEDRIAREIDEIVRSIEPDVTVSEILAAGMKESAAIEEKGKRNERTWLISRLILSALLLLGGFLLKERGFLGDVLYLAAWLIIGYDVLILAFKNILRGEYFEENFLMSIATIGAVFIREYPEAAAVMLFYQTGEFFQSLAVEHSKKSIKALLDIRPDYANLKTADTITKVDPSTVQIGQQIIVKPGERVPLDGVILSGASMIDTSALTGESLPRAVKTGDTLLSGTINQSGLLTVQVNKTFGDSTVSRILDLVRNAADKKAPTERFITKFSKVYTPIVVGLAVLISVLPPLFNNFTGWSEWLNRGLVFLVVSCPCALVLSIPLGFLGGISKASKNGILVKGSNYLEVLNHLDTVVFDKTGTLTEGIFSVNEISAQAGFSEETLLELAAHAEAHSTHPIARSILTAYGKTIDQRRIGEVKEVSGHGIEALIDGKKVLAGNGPFLQQHGVTVPEGNPLGTQIHVAADHVYAGSILIADRIKNDSQQAIRNLKNEGIRQVVMLTGDNEVIGKAVGQTLGMDRVVTNLLPEQKVEQVEALMAGKKNGKALAFVGDGINDAPVLARADVGIAMGGLGSDAAIEIARKTNRIVRQNIIFSLGVKGVVLVLGALGMTGMWEAVFADVGVMLLAVVNSMRLLR